MFLISTENFQDWCSITKFENEMKYDDTIS